MSSKSFKYLGGESHTNRIILSIVVLPFVVFYCIFHYLAEIFFFILKNFLKILGIYKPSIKFERVNIFPLFISKKVDNDVNIWMTSKKNKSVIRLHYSQGIVTIGESQGIGEGGKFDTSEMNIDYFNKLIKAKKSKGFSV